MPWSWPRGYCHGALRACLRLAGPYGQRGAAWGAGDRDGALAALEPSPRRLAAFSLAVDQPVTAAAALRRLAGDDRARPVLAARLAWRQGRLTDALQALDTAAAPGPPPAHPLTAEQALTAGSMITGSSAG